MLETAKNDLFNLKSDLTRHKEEQQEQLQQEMSHVDREIGKEMLICTHLSVVISLFSVVSEQPGHTRNS